MDREAQADVGTTLLDTAIEQGLDLEHLCGGNGLCGTCKVVVDDGADRLSPPSDADEVLLESSEREAGYRLSCQATVQQAGSLDVTIPTASSGAGSLVLTEGLTIDIDLDPAVQHYHVTMPEPTIEDNIADRERLFTALEREYDLDLQDIDLNAQQDLPDTIRAESHDGELHVTAIVYDEREVIDLRPGVTSQRYGLAVDIGTTTLAVYLLNLETGEIEGISSMLNPQRDHGEDIMTRMRFVRRHDRGRERLQAAIIDGINESIDELVGEADIDPSRIYEVSFVGNTAMHHLFLGIDPDRVAGSPYIPANHAPITVKARDLDIDINDAGYLYWLPISGGWVGPDKLAVLLVSDHHNTDETVVCIDIGTNGEVSVSTGDRLLATSAPAGPALEGGELTDGIRARPGAIDHISFDTETLEPAIETIDDEPPLGICGSGVIDAIAGMFKVGLIDRRGQFTEAAESTRRVRSRDDGSLEYVLVERSNAGVERDIVLTQGDIRDVQMAKAAIQAATRVLLDEVDCEEIDRLVVAGGFGNYIDPAAARTLGLYPDVPTESIMSLGNGAGIGAQLALLDRSARESAVELIEAIDYFEIAGTDVFRNNFLQAMYLPHQDLSFYPLVQGEVEADRELIEVEDPANLG